MAVIEFKGLVKNFLVLTSIALILGGCLSEKDESTKAVVAPTSPPSNSAPLISGSPSSAIVVGEIYSFSPNASDPDGDTLSFTIDNLPGWASFDAESGNLSGQPTLGNIGVYENILISVSDGEASASLPLFSISVDAEQAPPPSNSAPLISGSPSSAIIVGEMYLFSPNASDPDGDTLSFTIDNLPGWANFDAESGELSGQPTLDNVGVYENILISVSDGEASASLPLFSISVDQMGTFSATLSWTAPTLNEDGSALTDLSGYKLYWGTTPGSYSDSVTVDDVGTTTYVVENLSAGTYEFVATSFNASGVESRYSSPATKVLE